MKKIFYILSFVAATLSFSSCGDLLDLSPQDNFGSSNFWNNEAQVKGFMTGIHATFRSNYQMLFYLGEARGGTNRTGTSTQNTSLDMERIKSNLLGKDNTGITSWFGLYTPIMNINLFIDKVEHECTFLSDANRNSYLAQAYAFRAYYYFMLYRTYGGVPIVTTVELLNGKVSADKFYIPRSTPEETLKFIKDDINKSETLFGTSTAIPSRTDWSVYATKMLKTEIYLWSAKVATGDHAKGGTADLTIAKTALQSVIGNSNFSLQADFSKIFSTATRNNSEIIYTMHFGDPEATNWGGMFLYQDAVFVNQKYTRTGVLFKTDTLNLKATGGVFRHEYKTELFKSYDATDTRRDATFLDYYDKTGTVMGLVMKKGIGSVNSTNNRVYDSDIILYRYADALLMMAEIENGFGNSVAPYINQVRARAYGSNYNSALAYTDGNFAANELAILKEKDKEFVWEGKRWFDVVRMQDASGNSLAFSPDANYPTGTPLIPAASPHLLLWPIDVNTLAINPKLTQTPGY